MTENFIQLLKLFSGALILFTKKKDGSLCLCIDYWGLNTIIFKNRHFLPLIQSFLDLILGFWFFTKLYIIITYNSMWIQKSNKWKTAFYCRYGYFKYKVILFELENTPAAFQAYINLVLQKYINIFILVYLDNILIFSKKKENHIQHI